MRTCACSSSAEQYNGDAGQESGLALLNDLPPNTKNYIIQLSEFVRSLSFSALVSAIYKAYPAMRANSVFQG
jgi:hypothetical protein